MDKKPTKLDLGSFVRNDQIRISKIKTKLESIVASDGKRFS